MRGEGAYGVGMFEVRAMPELARWYYPVQYALGAVCFVGFGVVFWRSGVRDWAFWVALVAFVVSGATTWILDRKVIRRRPCPQCGAMLPRRKHPDGKMISIQYGCETCRILWDADGGEAEPVTYSKPL